MSVAHAPAVSVLLPVFNGARFLREAVDSVLGQSFGDFELVVIDDGSSDDSPKIIAAYERQDRRVRPIHAPHRGLVGTLNAGLAVCRARWVARMDADDVCLPDRLEAQLRFIERNPGVGLVGTYARYMGERGQILGDYRLGPTTIAEFERVVRAGRLVHLIHPTVMMDRELVIRSGGYDPVFRYVEDLELYNRLTVEGTMCLAVPRPTLHYRIHRQSVVIGSHLEMFRMARFTREVVMARRRGVSVPTFDEFLARERATPLVRRMLQRSRDVGGYLYRRGGIEMGRDQRLRAAACVCAAFCLAPGYVWTKVRSQLTSHRVG